jgi:hypothetical protein
MSIVARRNCWKKKAEDEKSCDTVFFKSVPPHILMKNQTIQQKQIKNGISG